MKKTIKIIDNIVQYNNYCDELKELVNEQIMRDKRIKLLELVIMDYDNLQTISIKSTASKFLKDLMTVNSLDVKDIAKIIDGDISTVYKMLKGTAGFSKRSIRILSEHFKVRQEAFNN